MKSNILTLQLLLVINVFKFMVMVVCNYFWVDDLYIVYVFHNKMHNKSSKSFEKSAPLVGV